MTEATATIVRSMTGHGHATGRTDAGDVTVEIRSVNHRGLKCSIRLAEPLSGLEANIEAAVRARLHRGAINISVKCSRTREAAGAVINRAALAAYIAACRDAIDQSAPAASPEHERDEQPGQRHDQRTAQTVIDVATLVNLPGVLSTDSDAGRDRDRLWQQVDAVLQSALDNLVSMRQSEGENMVGTLRSECRGISEALNRLKPLSAVAADKYRARLESKIERVLAEQDLSVAKVDVLREVQLYCDRADVNEEITRLESHLQLFTEVFGGPSGDGGDDREPTGRKLDFITQEMFRETNTIGSKAAHPDVSSHVVEIKCAIERMRELVQNLE